MQHAIATLTHLPAINLPRAVDVAEAVGGGAAIMYWEPTGNGTYHIRAGIPHSNAPRMAASTAHKIARAWAEMGLCANGTTVPSVVEG